MTDHENDEEAFLNAFDQREVERLESHFRSRTGTSPYRLERERVAGILARDRAYREAERIRETAQLEVAEGKTVSIRDAVDGPTPEQVELAERHGAGFRKFTPRLENGTVATVKAYRRRDVPQAHKMLIDGVIDYGGLKACSWYRQLYESTGLTGNIPSTDYQREVFANAAPGTVFNDWQLTAQSTFRAVRELIRPRHLALLDRMVLEDVPIHRAVRAARAFHRQAKDAFGKAVQQLVDAREALGES